MARMSTVQTMPRIMNITPTKPARFLALALALVGAGLLVLATPSLIADFLLLPGDPVHNAFLAGAPVSEADIDVLMRSRQDALRWRPTHEIYDDLAMAVVERARRLPTHPDVAQAIDWQMRALSLAPADSYGWARLAHLFLMTEGASASAARALENSIYAALYEPRLMLARATMAMQLKDRLDPAYEAQIPAMLRAAWAIAPAEMTQAAQQGGYISALKAARGDTR